MTILVQLGLSGHFAFAADGERLIVVAEMVEGEQAWLYATTSRQLLAKLGSPVTSCKVAVSANGESVAVASDDQGRSGGARVYDTASGGSFTLSSIARNIMRDNVLLGGVDLTGRGENSASGVASRLWMPPRRPSPGARTWACSNCPAVTRPFLIFRR